MLLHNNVLFTFCQTGVLWIMSVAGVSPGVPDDLVTRCLLTIAPWLSLGPGQEHGHGPGRGPRRPGGEHPGGREVRHAVASLGPQPRLVWSPWDETQWDKSTGG